jgi:hypothetical protein
VQVRSVHKRIAVYKQGWALVLPCPSRRRGEPRRKDDWTDRGQHLAAVRELSQQRPGKIAVQESGSGDDDGRVGSERGEGNTAATLDGFGEGGCWCERTVPVCVLWGLGCGHLDLHKLKRTGCYSDIDARCHGQ